MCVCVCMCVCMCVCVCVCVCDYKYGYDCLQVCVCMYIMQIPAIILKLLDFLRYVNLAPLSLFPIQKGPDGEHHSAMYFDILS